VVDLGPGSEAASLAGAACTLVSHLFPTAERGGLDDFERSLNEARCIESSRLLVAVLDHFDLPARLQPVELVVSNPLAHRLRAERVPVEAWPSQAWSIGAMPDSRKRPGWSGHMLVRVAHELLCDPNAGQFHREGRIAMPPCWTIRHPEHDWRSETWARLGIVSGLAPSPEHPQFPLLEMRRHPAGGGDWRRSAAARSDLGALVSFTVGLLERLRAGTLEPAIAAEVNDQALVFDLTSVIARYERRER
jgi:hypothetical protein